MRIGILGVGNIGATLTRRLVSAGHEVKVANSRGPETIPTEVTAAGGRAVHARDTVTDVDAVILSIPLGRVPSVASIVRSAPSEVTVLDTSNYYPARDGRIAAIDEGQAESEWVMEQLGGRPVVKAWNAISAASFISKATGLSKSTAEGDPDRIAIPVAADSEEGRAAGSALVRETGFDAVDAGPIAESWRQQPGAPAYCTDLGRTELLAALASAERDRSPRRRDLAVQVAVELVTDPGKGDRLLVDINRLLFLN